MRKHPRVNSPVNTDRLTDPALFQLMESKSSRTAKVLIEPVIEPGLIKVIRSQNGRRGLAPGSEDSFLRQSNRLTELLREISAVLDIQPTLLESSGLIHAEVTGNDLAELLALDGVGFIHPDRQHKAISA